MTRLPALAFCAIIASASHADQPAPFSEAVTGGSKLSQFFRAAQTTRVDVVGIGDSNQLFAGNGWDYGWILGVDNRLGTYASSLLSLGENEGNSANAGVGFRITATSSQGIFQYSGASSPYNDFLTPGIGMRPLNYIRVPADQSTSLLNHGMSLTAGSIITVTDPIRFHLSYAAFEDTPPNTFRPIVRLGQSPFTVLYESPPLSTQGEPGIVSSSFDFPGAATPAPLQFMLGRFNTTLNGPFVGYTARAERPTVASGGSFSTLYAFGSQSARDMAAAITAASDLYLTTYFDQIRNLQGDEKFVLVRINTGLNDRNENLPPVDGSDFPPNSPEAYSANLRVILNRINTIWSNAGWNPSELYFLITPSHPVDQPDQQILIDYRQAARELAAEFNRCAVVDFTLLTDASEMLQNNWYQSGGSDRNHLTLPAYETLALRELDALLTYTTCPDITGSGSVGLGDLNAVLSAFGTASPRADLNGDGIVNLQDLNALLQAFASTCSSSAHD
ncbi:MAG: GC-type dockerin domain-anchored protein [Phycisphaerales bacterium]